MVSRITDPFCDIHSSQLTTLKHLEDELAGLPMFFISACWVSPLVEWVGRVADSSSPLLSSPFLAMSDPGQMRWQDCRLQWFDWFCVAWHCCELSTEVLWIFRHRCKGSGEVVIERRGDELRICIHWLFLHPRIFFARQLPTCDSSTFSVHPRRLVLDLALVSHPRRPRPRSVLHPDGPC
jgi:hypothetical protein